MLQSVGCLKAPERSSSRSPVTLSRFSSDSIPLWAIKGTLEHAEMQRNPEDLIFFPNSAPRDEDDAASAKEPSVSIPTECFMRPAHLEQVGANRGDGKYAYHIAAIRAVVSRCPIASQPVVTILLRSYLGISGRKRKVCFEEEVLIPTVAGGMPDSTETGSDNSLVESLSVSDTHAVSNLREIRGFYFSMEWNTLVYNVKIDSPFEGEDLRSQVVLLEHVKGFWLLRTPMIKLEEVSAGELIGSSRWIAEQNADRNWGYLVEDRGIIWFMAFVLDKEGVPAVDYLPALAERVGKIGDRMQHLYVAADDPEEWGYRAISGFPKMLQVRDSVQNALAKGGCSIMSMEKVDLRTCGQFFSSLQNWFNDTFHDVLAALYDENIPEIGRSLKTSTMGIMPGGVLHLITTGAERFRLQAFLQLDGNSDDFPAPV